MQIINEYVFNLKKQKYFISEIIFQHVIFLYMENYECETGWHDAREIFGELILMAFNGFLMDLAS